MGWDSATFRDKGTEVSSLSWDKGTTGQAKNLTKAPDGPGRARTAKIQDEPEQPKSGTERDRAEKDILKRGNDVLKQIFAPALVKGTTRRPVPVCPGTSLWALLPLFGHLQNLLTPGETENE